LPTPFRFAKKLGLNGFAILPGLVNSHCHLEFSDLSEPLPAGDSFPDWIRRLLVYRASKKVDPEQAAFARRAAIRSGIRESYEAGVRWVVDMTTQPWDPFWIDSAVSEIFATLSPAVAPKNPITIQPCIELLDISENFLKPSLAFASKQANAPESTRIGRMGYAPHASYTASLRVTQMCAELSQTERRLVTIHLAESIDELEWLEERKGTFLDLLGPIISSVFSEALGQNSEHVQLLTQAWRAAIAHGNYLSHSDLLNLAVHAKNMAIVHCPRTHRHFGHRHSGDPHGGSLRYPLAERMELGVRHFLGTDSRASNPDLNLWSEAQLVRAEHPSVTSLEILKMITTDAAEFLGIADRYGAIRVGQPANLTAIKLSGNSPRPGSSVNTHRIYDSVLSSDTESSPLEMVLKWNGK
ncbi:MAG: amidohydrolase family protein, partial [Pirellula sp.]